MDLYEYQAKQLFAKHGVPGTAGFTATTADEAAAVARKLGTPVVVKAQVKAGGRGKAGGVKFAADPAAARTHADAILGRESGSIVCSRRVVRQMPWSTEESDFLRFGPAGLRASPRFKYLMVPAWRSSFELGRETTTTQYGRL